MGELESLAREAIAAFENLDGDALVTISDTDVQGVDELSRKWLRGANELKDYINGLKGMVTDIQTTMSDFHETVLGDAGLVTFWLEQDYVAGGETQHVSAPTSCVARKDNGQWRVVLFHTVPLPEESN